MAKPHSRGDNVWVYEPEKDDSKCWHTSSMDCNYCLNEWIAVYREDMANAVDCPECDSDDTQTQDTVN